MIFSLAKKDVEELKTTNILPQTPFWGRVKSKQGFTPTGFELTVSRNLLDNNAKRHEKKEDDILVLIKYIDNNSCYAYVPYGPKIEPELENQGVFLEHLSETIKSQLIEQRPNISQQSLERFRRFNEVFAE